MAGFEQNDSPKPIPPEGGDAEKNVQGDINSPDYSQLWRKPGEPLMESVRSEQAGPEDLAKNIVDSNGFGRGPERDANIDILSDTFREQLLKGGKDLSRINDFVKEVNDKLAASGSNLRLSVSGAPKESTYENPDGTSGKRTDLALDFKLKDAGRTIDGTRIIGRATQTFDQSGKLIEEKHSMQSENGGGGGGGGRRFDQNQKRPPENPQGQRPRQEPDSMPEMRSIY